MDPRYGVARACQAPPVLEAGLWAGLGQAALIVGALLVARFPRLTEPRYLGLVMAFGAGTLISAVTADLVIPAYRDAGERPVALGLIAGAGGYYLLTEWLNRRAEREDPEEPVELGEDAAEAAAGSEAGLEALPAAADERAARNLSVGMVLDGIPESIAIGLTLLGSSSVSIALVGAVFLSNLPESIGVAAALLAGGRALRDVLARFAVIVIIGAVAGAVGYGILKPSEADLIAIIQSIAAGAMIVVTVNEMIPLAVRGAGRHAGLAAAAGFALAAFLSTLSA